MHWLGHYGRAAVWGVGLPACLFAASTAQGGVELAKSGDSFVDSIGLNGVGGPYVNKAAAGGSSVYGQTNIPSTYLMGVRYSRFELRTDNTGDLTALTNQYNNYGVHYDVLVSWLWTDPNPKINPTSSVITNALPYIKQLPIGSVASIEGNYEADMPQESGDYPTYSSTMAQAQSNQATLYSAVKSDSTLSNVPVIAWTLGKNWPWGGDVGYGSYTSTSYDYESMHSYPGSTPIAQSLSTPGSQQWITVANSIVPSGSPLKPIVATETGFPNTTDASTPNNSVLAQSKTDLMLLAENFSQGIVRTYLYDDYGNTDWDIAGHPAGTALTNLISTLGEAKWNSTTHTWVAPSFTPSSLNFSIGGAPSTLHHQLLEKSNGVFYLMVWNDVSVWDDTNSKDINTTLTGLTLQLKSGIQSAGVYVQGADGSYVFSNLSIAGQAGSQSITFNAPDSVELIELTPVPEPGMMGSILFGFIALGWRSRCRRGSLS